MPDKDKPSKVTGSTKQPDKIPDRSSKFVWEVGDLVVEKAPKKPIKKSKK
jgi:hypothetical protein